MPATCFTLLQVSQGGTSIAGEGLDEDFCFRPWDLLGWAVLTPTSGSCCGFSGARYVWPRDPAVRL